MVRAYVSVTWLIMCKQSAQRPRRRHVQNDVRCASPVPKWTAPVGERLAVAPTTWRDTAKCESHADVRKLPSGQDDIPASKTDEAQNNSRSHADCRSCTAGI